MSVLNELEALLDRATEEAVSAAVAGNNREWQRRMIINERLDVFKGNVFLIRDRPKSEWEGDLHCEYATLDADIEWLVWHPCVEGVMFDDIQPLASLADLAKMDRPPTA